MTAVVFFIAIQESDIRPYLGSVLRLTVKAGSGVDCLV